MVLLAPPSASTSRMSTLPPILPHDGEFGISKPLYRRRDIGFFALIPDVLQEPVRRNFAPETLCTGLVIYGCRNPFKLRADRSNIEEKRRLAVLRPSGASSGDEIHQARHIDDFRRQRE